MAASHGINHHLLLTLHLSMVRKILSLLMVVSLCWITLACSSSSSPENQTPKQQTNTLTQTRLGNGKYPVQQASYNDVNGEYSLFLLNANPAIFRTKDLQMARLTDQEESGGQKSYLNIDGDKVSLHISENFKIEYIHAVTETKTNSQTGQKETVIVRQESSFWTPFAGALAGQMVGNLLFTPRYYVPPVYQPGVILSGYGGYGNSYSQAVSSYQSRYQAPPPAVKNTQANLRTTGNLKNSSYKQPSLNQPASSSQSDRPTGSGFGSSNLKSSGNSSGLSTPRSGSFGSSQRSNTNSSRRSSFGSGKRR